MHERINESSPSLIWSLFLWCETAVFLLPIGYMTQIMPRREKRLKKPAKIFIQSHNHFHCIKIIQNPQLQWYHQWMNQHLKTSKMNLKLLNLNQPFQSTVIMHLRKYLKQKGKLKVMKLMLSNLNFIHLRHTYFRKQKLVVENGHFMPIGVKTTLGCIITQKKMQHFVMYV